MMLQKLITLHDMESVVGLSHAPESGGFNRPVIICRIDLVVVAPAECVLYHQAACTAQLIYSKNRNEYIFMCQNIDRG